MFVEEYGGLELHDVERSIEQTLLGLEITSSVMPDGRIMIKLSYNGKLISDTVLNAPNVETNKQRLINKRANIKKPNNFEDLEDSECACDDDGDNQPRRYRAFCSNPDK